LDERERVLGAPRTGGTAPEGCPVTGGTQRTTLSQAATTPLAEWTTISCWPNRARTLGYAGERPREHQGVRW